MSKDCPTCGGKGIVFTDCPYCRDCDSFEHSELARKICVCCNNTGYLESVCPTCAGE